jgi:DNA polymerase-3 subunit beta
MKFTVNAGELSTALRGPCDRAKPHNTIPILKHIRIEAGDAQVSLLGHDLDSSSEARIDAEITTPGACALPAEPLSRLVNGLPKSASVAFDLDAMTCIIKSGRSRYKLPTLDVANMPPALTATGVVKFAVTEDDLEQLFVRPRNALNPKDQRPMCNGVFLHGDAGKLSSVGTSGFVLMRFSTDIDNGDFKGAIIPRVASDELLKFGGGEIEISDRIISITNGHRIYAAKMIDAIFPPDYRRIIPDLELSAPVIIYREGLMESLSRLRSVGDFIESDLIDISVSPDEISISITGAADGAETIECEASESKLVCVRSTQLLEALKVMRGDKLHLHITGQSAPMRVVDPSEPTAINVLMPCASTTRRAEAA